MIAAPGCCRRCGMKGCDKGSEGEPRCTYCGIAMPDFEEALHEFNVRISEYGIAMYHGQGEKARVLADVLASMFEIAMKGAKP